MARLCFKETLVQKGAPRLSVGEVLKRLRVLQTELADHDQEQIERSSLDTVIVELEHESLLNHKDKGVRAYTACCLADILRLCAPDAPYTPSQLNRIFELFVSQLKGLANSESPYYAQTFYLLESLSQVKSVVLMADLSNGPTLTLELFRMFFEMATPEQPRNVLIAMVDILAQLVDESPTLPSKVIDMMLAQFIGTGSKINYPFSSKNEKPPAYIMVKQLFNICAERLQRYVCQYFTDIIFEANRSIDWNPQAELDDATMKEVEKAHYLVYELYVASPFVLQNIMPQLEQELMVENLTFRLLSTTTVSEMLSVKEQRVDFIKEYPSLWKSWVSRGNDKSPFIRIKWLEGLFNLLVNFGYSTEVMPIVIEGILTKHVDIDEKVRMTVCKMIGSLDYHTICERIPNNVLEALSDRCKDRKQIVRVEAMNCLGKLYNMAYDDILKDINTMTNWFSLIPSRILHAIYINDKEINILLESVLYQYILDYTEVDDTKRTERMLVMFKNLDSRAKYAFLSLGRNQPKYAKIMEYYLCICEKYNGGMISDNEKILLSLKDAITRLKSLYGDPAKAELDFEKFSRLNDRRSYKLLRDCMNLSSDYKQIQKSQKEFFKRIEQNSETLMETFKPLIFKISPLLYNKSAISPIIEYSRSNKNLLANTAREFLKEISLIQPSIYKAHIAEILSLIKEHDIKSNISCAHTLKVYAQYITSFPQDISTDSKLLKAIISFALEGTPSESKQAVFILLHSMNKEKFSHDLVNELFDDLSVDSTHFLTKLSALSQLVLYAPEELEPKADQYTSFLIKEILLVNLITEEPSEEDWIEENILEDECKAKMLALKILVNRLRANVNSEGIQQLAKPVFRLLASIMTNMGEISKERNTPSRFQSHIRLTAGRLVLKLSSFNVFEEMISVEDFYKMSLLIQDPCFQVRYNFVKKLMKGLNLDKLTARYYVPIFLMAHEPEEEFKQEIIKWIKSCVSTYRTREIFVIESAIVRLIHFLAHHPDFSTDPDDLIDFAKYINFYLELVATSDCLSLLLHLVQRIKQVYDIISPENSDRLYVLSDLSQALIRIMAASNSWTMQTYPKKLKLPTELYAPLTNAKVATEIAQRVYIDKGIEERLQSLMKFPKLVRKRKFIAEKHEFIKRRNSKNIVKIQKKKSEDIAMPLRRSRRILQTVNYVENGDDDDDDQSIENETKDDENIGSEAEMDSLSSDSCFSS